MAKKVPAEIEDELWQIDHYKWQFLRRNPDYITDCEKWSGRRRNEWRKTEIILGYPFKGNVRHFTAYGGALKRKNDAFQYYRKHIAEWSCLRDHLPMIHKLKKRGARPFETKNQGTWRGCYKKWLINYPLNPDCDLVPFFVQIASQEIISEYGYKGCPSGVFENDVVLSKGTTSFIAVNWAAHKKYLVDRFERLITEKKALLNEYRSEDSKTQFKIYDFYLKVWSLHHVGGLTVVEIAERLSRESEGGEGKSESAVRKALKKAEELVYGGYKEIGK